MTNSDDMVAQWWGSNQGGRIDPRTGKWCSSPFDESGASVDLVWSRWCSYTKRAPEYVSMSDTTRNLLTEALVEWQDKSVGLVLHAVRAALYAPPVVGDGDDIMRLVLCLKNTSKRRYATDVMNSVHPTPRYWSPPSDRDNTIHCVLGALHLDSMQVLSDREQDTLMSIISLPEQELSILLSKAQDVYGDDPIMPSKVLSLTRSGSVSPTRVRVSKNRHDISTRNDPSGGYSRGRKEDAVLNNNDTLEYDKYAENLILDGYALADIVSYHRQMPRGYWRDVADMIDDDQNLSLDEVYDRLEVTYRVHPKDRVLPDDI